jgi:hypothetical protein
LEVDARLRPVVGAPPVIADPEDAEAEAEALEAGFGSTGATTAEVGCGGSGATEPRGSSAKLSITSLRAVTERPSLVAGRAAAEAAVRASMGIAVMVGDDENEKNGLRGAGFGLGGVGDNPPLVGDGDGGGTVGPHGAPLPVTRTTELRGTETDGRMDDDRTADVTISAYLARRTGHVTVGGVAEPLLPPDRSPVTPTPPLSSLSPRLGGSTKYNDFGQPRRPPNSEPR